MWAWYLGDQKGIEVLPMRFAAFFTAFRSFSIDFWKPSVPWTSLVMNFYPLSLARAVAAPDSDDRVRKGEGGERKERDTHAIFLEVVGPGLPELVEDRVDILLKVRQVLGLGPDEIRADVLVRYILRGLCGPQQPVLSLWYMMRHSSYQAKDASSKDK